MDLEEEEEEEEEEGGAAAALNRRKRSGERRGGKHSGGEHSGGRGGVGGGDGDLAAMARRFPEVRFVAHGPADVSEEDALVVLARAHVLLAGPGAFSRLAAVLSKVSSSRRAWKQRLYHGHVSVDCAFLFDSSAVDVQSLYFCMA